MKKAIVNKIFRWYQKTEALREECILYLSELLENNGGTINWENNAEIPDFLTVSYDGNGNLDNSNVFCTVFGITYKSGSIYLDTMDCKEYEIDWIPSAEVCDLVYWLYQYRKELKLK